MAGAGDDDVDAQHEYGDGTGNELRIAVGDLMREAGLSQRDVACQIGVSESTVSRRLRGSGPVTWPQMEPLVGACLDHAREQGRTISPPGRGDLEWWRSRACAGHTTRSAGQEERPDAGSVLERLSLHFTPVATPILTVAAVLIVVGVGLGAYVSVDSADENGTGTPAPVPTLIEKDVAEERDEDLSAGRSGPRSSAAPAPPVQELLASAPTGPTSPVPGLGCGLIAMDIDDGIATITTCSRTADRVLVCTTAIRLDTSALQEPFSLYLGSGVRVCTTVGPNASPQALSSS